MKSTLQNVSYKTMILFHSLSLLRNTKKNKISHEKNYLDFIILIFSEKFKLDSNYFLRYTKLNTRITKYV